MFIKKVACPPLSFFKFFLIFFLGLGQGVLRWIWKSKNVISCDIM